MVFGKSGVQISSSERTIEFKLPAPQAKSVSVCGTFNHWNTASRPMTKDYRGIWRTSIRLTPGKYEYRFFVDGQWIDDPHANKTTANQFGSKNAVLEVK